MKMRLIGAAIGFFKMKMGTLGAAGSAVKTGVFEATHTCIENIHTPPSPFGSLMMMVDQGFLPFLIDMATLIFVAYLCHGYLL